MADKIDYFQLRTGRKLSDLTRTPTLAETVDKRIKSIRSNYPLRSLGVGVDGELLISEEEREDHLHIIGTTRKGKSRFLEYLIRDDIRRGNGVCLLDPSHGGQTAYDILRFCVREGFQKVCLIDPHTHRLTGVQPFHHAKRKEGEDDQIWRIRDQRYKEVSVANVLDSIKILFGSKDLTETPVIQKYLGAILNVLHNAEMTLYEAKYFSEYERSKWKRNRILDASSQYDWHRQILEESFATYHRFDKDIGTSTRRLEPMFNSRLDWMFGVPGVDFAKMIAEGWVVLVNLFPGQGFTDVQARLLGTTVINEVISALDRLRDRNWKGVYYLYVDEAGRYANRNLANLLSHAGKTGLRITVAHQYFRQFEDPYILDAVKNQTKTKIMFDMPNPNDRLEMIKLLGYGGEIPHELATFANQNLPKQQAVIKLGGGRPQRIRIPDVESIDIAFDVNDFLHHEWNYSVKEALEIINSRFKTDEPIQSRPKKQGTVSPKKRAVSNGKTTSGTKKTGSKSLFDSKD